MNTNHRHFVPLRLGGAVLLALLNIPFAQADDAPGPAPGTTDQAKRDRPLSARDAADLEQRFQRLFAAVLNAASKPQEVVTFWTAENTLGGHVIRNGRYREFYLAHSETGKTLWFRDTAGPNEEFPRTRVTYEGSPDGAPSVSLGFYVTEGPAVHLPQDTALTALREACDFWLLLLHKAARSPEQLAFRGAR
jgi:hypothetical protein